MQMVYWISKKIVFDLKSRDKFYLSDLATE